MIDTARWALVEAWLALGLRLRWLAPYEVSESNRLDLFDDEETRTQFLYLGRGEWGVVRPGDSRRAFGFPPNDAPMMGVESMRHELAHYLVADEYARGQKNFGLAPSGNANDDDVERRTLLAESVIDAILRGSNRMVAAALQAPPASRRSA